MESLITYASQQKAQIAPQMRAHLTSEFEKIEFDSTQQVAAYLFSPKNMARLEPVAGSFTATATTKWDREDADKFFAVLEDRLPKPQVRQIGLAIELGGTQSMTVGLPGGKSFTGKCWSKIGTARSGHTQRQLRKFVDEGAGHGGDGTASEPRVPERTFGIAERRVIEEGT